MMPHGSQSRYTNDGCRCKKCCQTNTDNHRDYMALTGRRPPPIEIPVEHLVLMYEEGMTVRALSYLSGLGETTIKMRLHEGHAEMRLPGRKRAVRV